MGEMEKRARKDGSGRRVGGRERGGGEGRVRVVGRAAGNTSATTLDLLFAAVAAWVKGREKKRESDGR